MFNIGSVFYAALLLINAMAVLNEERFLARVGWSSSQSQSQNVAFHQSFDQSGYSVVQGGDMTVKARLINLISAVRTLMRIPLIGLNIVVIIYEMVMG